ncbi:hypothetical protein L798_14538 [Zootermopsis nevadensis]|uniref:Uncharacterized protein n=1 Tax=Zootermopsis nevadensis TaxID=136037 RepID=A0A067QZ52_ZOONE|nr:hypothetical protein L798_14538 [Zootermopsis nevadensis]
MRYPLKTFEIIVQWGLLNFYCGGLDRGPSYPRVTSNGFRQGHKHRFSFFRNITYDRQTDIIEHAANNSSFFHVEALCFVPVSNRLGFFEQRNKSPTVVHGGGAFTDTHVTVSEENLVFAFRSDIYSRSASSKGIRNKQQELLGPGK